MTLVHNSLGRRVCYVGIGNIAEMDEAHVIVETDMCKRYGQMQATKTFFGPARVIDCLDCYCIVEHDKDNELRHYTEEKCPSPVGISITSFHVRLTYSLAKLQTT